MTPGSSTFPWPYCKHGHPMNGGNLYVTKQGHRRCRTCKRLSDERRRPERMPRKYPNATGVRATKYRDWAMTTWQEMSPQDRWLVGMALGYMTLEQADA